MNNQQNTYVVAGSIIVAGLIVAVGIVASGGGGGAQDDTQQAPSVAEAADIEPVSADEHIVGNSQADLFVIEFSDPECPFCKRFHETMNSVMDEYAEGGRVAWVYRHFPIPQLHSKAPEEAHALECAAELGGNNGFWSYTNALFEETPSNNNLNLSRLPEIAEEVGLDKEAFEVCQASGRWESEIERDVEDALASGGRGTPHNVFLTQSGESFLLPGAMPRVMTTEIIHVILSSIDEGDDEERVREKVGVVVAKYR